MTGNAGKTIYMDHHATTPALPEVVEAMLPYFTRRFGNPASSTHEYGRVACEAVDEARGRVAALIGAAPAEIVFTSGATESNNLAVRGIAEESRRRGNHIVTCVIEHHAILDTCERLEEKGFRVTRLPVDRNGLVDPEAIDRAITEETILVSIQFANGEIGTIQPIEAIGKIANRRGVTFHCDAVQAVGRVPVDVRKCGIDLMSISAHKMYGPKGIGALFLRDGIPITPQITGGGQEGDIRSGTLNVPAIVGFGKACEIARREEGKEAERQRRLRDRLRRGLEAGIEAVALSGHPERRLPNNLNFRFRWVDGEAIVQGVKGIALSTGSACSTGEQQASYVIRALGVPEEEARGSIRFGLGRDNTEEEIDMVIEQVKRAVRRLREMSPLP